MSKADQSNPEKPAGRGPGWGMLRRMASLKLAVVVLMGLALSLATATTLESIYDTPTAQYWVYRSTAFLALLALLGVNIAAVAISRWPWRKAHIPFLLAHLGILTLLAGSWATQKFGLDGTIRVAEGESTGTVDLDTAHLVVGESGGLRLIPVTWIPPEAKFSPIVAVAPESGFRVEVDRFISHADPQISFEPAAKPGEAPASGPVTPVAPALKIRIKGGPMRVSQEYWLWAGDPAWSAVQAGPALLVLGAEPPQLTQNPQAVQGPRFAAQPLPDGGLSWTARSSDGGKRSGKLAPGRVSGQVLDPGWRGGVSVTVEEWVPQAAMKVEYKPAKMQYGPAAPLPALHVTIERAGDKASAWLGQGERTMLRAGGRELELGYFSRRVVLPFSVRLDRFSIEHYEGTRDPASFSSRVTVFGRPSGAAVGAATGVTGEHSADISMNEPLEYAGYTLYQASYENAEPRPVVSIFSVNRDPGRFWKYLGSLLLVLGSILLFAMKYRQKKAAGVPASQEISLL